jgi:cbb3-type cytochrome oxidase maturation protein
MEALSAFFVFAIVVALLAAVGVAAFLWGVDSRFSNDEHNRFLTGGSR